MSGAMAQRTVAKGGLVTVAWPQVDWQSLLSVGQEVLEWQARATASFKSTEEDLLLSCVLECKEAFICIVFRITPHYAILYVILYILKALYYIYYVILYHVS